MVSASRPDELPDRELVARATAGDPEAFAGIYRRHHQVVYRFARAMTNCPADAQDVTQDVFVTLFRELARYDPERASLTTYLYGIARNLSRSRLRRISRLLSLDMIHPDGDRPADLPHPVEVLEGAERADQVRQALSRLPAAYRELIILCDLHGLSYADAAAVVQISTSAVRSRLHRGRGLLRRRLAPIARPVSGTLAAPARCTT